MSLLVCPVQSQEMDSMIMIVHSNSGDSVIIVFEEVH